MSITVTDSDEDTRYDGSITLPPGGRGESPHIVTSQTVTVELDVGGGPSASTEWNSGPPGSPMLVRVRESDVAFVEGGCDTEVPPAAELHNTSDDEVSGTITVERSLNQPTKGRTPDPDPRNRTVFTPEAGWTPVLEETFTLASGTAPGAERRYCELGPFELGRVRVELTDGSRTTSRIDMSEGRKLLVVASNGSVDASAIYYCYPREYCSG